MTRCIRHLVQFISIDKLTNIISFNNSIIEVYVGVVKLSNCTLIVEKLNYLALTIYFCRLILYPYGMVSNAIEASEGLEGLEGVEEA